MVICFRCQINISEYECEICNGFYCSECDKFIHSKKPKNNHTRKPIIILENSKITNTQEKIESESKLNINFNHENKNKKEGKKEYKLLSENYENNNLALEKNNDINYKIKNEYRENEKVKEEETNNILSQNLNLNNCVKKTNKIIEKKYEYKLDEKDQEIKLLQKQITEQRELINKLKQENNNLEELIEKTDSEKAELYQQQDRIINKRQKISEFYEEKKNEIEKIHNLDKYRLIEDFEEQMREISQNYISKKGEYIKGIQDIDDKMREYENAKEEEKRALLDEIDRLKNEGINIEKEQEYLTKSNDEINNKLRQTSTNIDLLRTNTLGGTGIKGKKKIKNKGN